MEELRRFSFLDRDAVIRELIVELPRYLVIADGTEEETEGEKLRWWARNEANLPNWSSVVKKVRIVRPSSASAKRVLAY